MPLYLYKCLDCGKELEKFTHIRLRNDRVECPKCGTSMVRTLNVPSIHYKARGFTGAGRGGGGRIDHLRHSDGSPLTEADLNRIPQHLEDGTAET